MHNELVLLVCFSTVDDMNHLIWSNPIHYKKSVQFHILIIELQYQYLNYITGIPVLTIVQNFEKNSQYWNKFLVLRSPSTGDPLFYM